MKVCSVCQQCYDDSITTCEFENNQTLTHVKQGDCCLVEGYRIEKQIESGSPVELFKATHLASKKSVIIRFIKIDESTAKLRNELQATVGINHPNLARVFEFGELESDENFIVLEDVQGESLHDYLLKSSPVLERVAINIARQIAEGLEELHNAGVLHRNINPENIFLINSENHSFEVKLHNYDFSGIVQNFVVKEANGIAPKTEVLRYFSPEQFTDEKINFKSDIYSLAVVFYEMLLARSPYESNSSQAIKSFVFNENDIDCLHHDLRALLAYTLRESLQKRLSLRPRKTNNLVRQLRHLELLATPAGIVSLEKTTIQPKREKAREVLEVNESQQNENNFGSKVENSVIQTDLLENIAEEIIIENEAIKIADVEVLKEKDVEIETAELELENDFSSEKEPELLEDEIESLAFSEKQTISDSINQTLTISEPEIVEEIKKAEKIDLVEAEKFSEDIYATREDLGEVIDQEIDFSEYVEVEDFEDFENLQNVDYVEEEIQKETSFDRHVINSFGAYAKEGSNSSNKVPYYIAGSVAVMLLASFFVVMGVDWQEKIVTSAKPKKPQIVKEKSEKTMPEESSEVAENNTEEDLESEQVEITKGNETQDLDEVISIDSIEKERKTQKSTKATNTRKISKTDEKNLAKKVTKKQKTNQKSNPKDKAAKKKNTKKQQSKVVKSNGMTRPRIVPNVKTNE